MLAITFHVDFAFAGVASIPLASFAGSIRRARDRLRAGLGRRRGLSTIVLLLAGVTMTAFFQALILFTRYLADFADTFRTVRWLMGTLDVGSFAPILAALPIVLIAFAMLATLPRSLDLISLGTDAAAARAASTSSPQSGWRWWAPRSRRGPRCRWRARSAFIGLVVPHLVRLVVGSDHRLVLPASALFGARVPDRLRRGGAHGLVVRGAAGRHRDGA